MQNYHYVLLVVLHTPLTHVLVVQVLPEHAVFCVVFCVKALADDVKMSVSVRLDMSVLAYDMTWLL
jgi:hypothetical protein